MHKYKPSLSPSLCLSFSLSPFPTSTSALTAIARFPRSQKIESILNRLTDDEGVLGGEVVLGNLEVQGSGSLSYTAGDVVVRTVAGAEPAAIVTGFTDGDTTKVSADT